MAGCRAEVVSGLVSAYCWAEPRPGVSGCRTWDSQGWWARPGPRHPGCLLTVGEAGFWVSAGSLGFITFSRVESCVPEENRCVDHLHLYTSTGFSLPTQKVQTRWQSMKDSCVSLFPMECPSSTFLGATQLMLLWGITQVQCLQA